MPKSQQRECLHCKELFQPHCRNVHHQKFCSKPECRKASKADSQRRWLSKPENRDVFRGSANVERVRQWREANPGYWKRSAQGRGTLQEVLPQAVPSQATHQQELELKISLPPLQDLLVHTNPTQNPVLVGLISHLIDSPLQEDIAHAAHRLILRGMNILDMKSGTKMNPNNEDQNESSAPNGSGAYPDNSVGSGTTGMFRSLNELGSGRFQVPTETSKLHDLPSGESSR